MNFYQIKYSDDGPFEPEKGGAIRPTDKDSLLLESGRLKLKTIDFGVIRTSFI